MVWKYNAGLVLIGAFVFIWVCSAEVTQKIFVEYKQPFAVTYLGISLMAIFLPIAACKDWLGSLLEQSSLKKLYTENLLFDNSVLDVPLKLNYMHDHSEEALEDDFIADMDYIDQEKGLPLVDINHKDEFHFLEEGYDHNSWDLVKCSLYLAPIWFATEYFSNSALANTSVASTTILTSTSGLFTLLFGALLGQDSINIAKMIAVIISMSGAALTTLGKTWAPDEILSVSVTAKHSVIGDVFGLLSAVCYGLFTVLLKKSAGSGEKADMQRCFGYIGIFTLLGLWWLGNGHFENLCPWIEQHEFLNFSFVFKEAAHYFPFLAYQEKIAFSAPKGVSGGKEHFVISSHLSKPWWIELLDTYAGGRSQVSRGISQGARKLA